MGKQQEGGESRISGKDTFLEYLTIIQHWLKLVGVQVSSAVTLAHASPSHPRELPSKSPRRRCFYSRKITNVGRSFSTFCSSPTATSYLCTSIPELNRDKQLEPLALIHQNNQTFQKLLSGLAHCLTHSKLCNCQLKKPQPNKKNKAYFWRLLFRSRGTSNNWHCSHHQQRFPAKSSAQHSQHMTMSALCDMAALKMLFLGGCFKKKNRKHLMLYILLREREIASLWKRSRFIRSIFSILCNIIDFYLNLLFNMVLSREDKAAHRGF